MGDVRVRTQIVLTGGIGDLVVEINLRREGDSISAREIRALAESATASAVASATAELPDEENP